MPLKQETHEWPEGKPEGKPALSTKDILALIWATYKLVMPPVILFSLVFLLVAWLLTAVFF